jgi:hypothetical protein
MEMLRRTKVYKIHFFTAIRRITIPTMHCVIEAINILPSPVKMHANVRVHQMLLDCSTERNNITQFKKLITGTLR